MKVQPGEKRPRAKTLSANLASREREPNTVFCEGSGFDRGNSYDVGVVLSTTGKILKKARLPSVPFNFAEKEEPTATAPSVTRTRIKADWSEFLLKFSTAVTVKEEKRPFGTQFNTICFVECCLKNFLRFWLRIPVK